jgi:Domain of unknown function (DUF1707)/FHA domain
MGGSAADTPATPEFLRASDAERDHAINELRQEFVEGRLSHETFMFRMQTALGARHRGQLAGLFTDLPPRRARPFNPAALLARIRAALRRQDRNTPEPTADWSRSAQAPPELPVPRGMRDAPWPQGTPSPPGLAPAGPAAAPWSVSGEPGISGGCGVPAPLVFPPGSRTSFTIGRTQECDLRIADMSVSRLHARLDRSEDGWLLSDLRSHNGTRVNGWLVREPVPVRAGDLLQFGSATFIIQGEGPEATEGPESPRKGAQGGYGGREAPL